MVLCETLLAMEFRGRKDPGAVAGHHQMTQQERVRQLLLAMEPSKKGWAQRRDLLRIHSGQHVGHLVGTQDGRTPGAAVHAPVVPEPRVVRHPVQSPQGRNPAREHQHGQTQDLAHQIERPVSRVAHRVQRLPPPRKTVLDEPNERLAYRALGFPGCFAPAARAAVFFSGTWRWMIAILSVDISDNNCLTRRCWRIQDCTSLTRSLGT